DYRCLREMPTFGYMLYLALAFIISFFVEKAIDFIVSLVTIAVTLPDDTWLIAGFIRYLLIMMISPILALMVLRYFNVDRSEEDVLAKFDQLLQEMKFIQRAVEIRLATGASRDELRVLEDVAASAWERVRYVKARYESITLYRLK
ncbi:hypothetical protein PENTCL1PPCAC_10052, partial [Pristionchus entomophagus]